MHKSEIGWFARRACFVQLQLGIPTARRDCFQPLQPYVSLSYCATILSFHFHQLLIGMPFLYVCRSRNSLLSPMYYFKLWRYDHSSACFECGVFDSAKNVSYFAEYPIWSWSFTRDAIRTDICAWLPIVAAASKLLFRLYKCYCSGGERVEVHDRPWLH